MKTKVKVRWIEGDNSYILSFHVQINKPSVTKKKIFWFFYKTEITYCDTWERVSFHLNKSEADYFLSLKQGTPAWDVAYKLLLQNREAWGVQLEKDLGSSQVHSEYVSRCIGGVEV